MSYIGRQNLGGAYRQLDDISSGFDGSDTTHTMQVNSQNVTVGDVNQIILSLGGVIQKPGTDFTVSGSTLTFTTAPAANTSFFAILLGSDNGGTVTPTDGSVTGDKLASTVTTSSNITTTGTTSLDGAVTINSSGADKDFRVESDDSTHLLFVDGGNDKVLIDSGNSSTAPARTLHVRSGDANVASFEGHQGEGFVISSGTDGRIDLIGYDDGASAYNKLVMRSTGSGDQLTLTTDGEVQTPLQPSFRVLSADMTNIARNQYVNITFNSQLFDIGSNFDTSNYTFTAPVTGKYFLGTQILFQSVSEAGSYLGVRVETSNHGYWSYLHSINTMDADATYYHVTTAGIYDMDANDTAYVRLYLNDSAASSNVLDINSGATLFTGMLIG